MSCSISVVIPVYNSKKSLNKLYEKLSVFLSKHYASYEIILVDDGSRDNSYEEMTRLHSQDNKVKIIKLLGNFGQQNAVMCGLHYSNGDVVVTMDDDLQNPPEEIEKLLSKLQEGYDVVYGIPVEKMHSSYRNWGAKMRDYLFDRICKKPANIKLSSFRAMNKSLVQKITNDKTPFVYISAITFKNRVKAGNILVKHNPREYGISNYSFSMLAKLFIKLLVNYSPLTSGFVKRTSPQFEIEETKL